MQLALPSMAAPVMSLVHRAAARAERVYHQNRFDSSVQAVFDTPPVAARQDGVVVLSMIGRRHMAMYLCAAKSFLVRLGRGRALVIDDGSLTPREYALLRRHLPGVEIVHIGSIRCRALPKGGTCERLELIGRLAGENYVIQLDSDTLTIGDIADVRRQVDGNRPFILGGEAGARVRPLLGAAARAAFHGVRHYQSTLEQALWRHPMPEIRKYARGCSAFAGFPKGAPVTSLVHEFATWPLQAVGARAVEWGTEQVASNYVLANLPGAVVLPYSRYMNHWGEPLGRDVRFAHFIGTYRHAEGRYRMLAEETIEWLNRILGGDAALDRTAAA